MIKHHWLKSTRGVKGLIQLIIPKKSWQKPGDGTWCRGHRRVSFMAFSGCFLIHPRSTYSGVKSLTIGWAFQHHSSLKKIYHRPIWWRNSLSEDSLVSNVFSLWQVNRKLDSTVNVPAMQSDEMSSIIWDLIVERESWILQVVLWPQPWPAHILVINLKYFKEIKIQF